MKRWLKILEAFREGKFPKYDYGLTPRFLVGAIQIPIGRKFDSRELAYRATEEMFNEMQSFEEEGKVVVSNKCDVQHGSVVRLADRPRYGYSTEPSFNEIWSRYGDEIVAGNYQISQDEKKTLEKIFDL